jgi:ClpP class serine protease
VWLAKQAVELGLVDEIGDIEHAIDVAAEQAGVPGRGAPVRIRRPFVTRLVDRFATRIAASVVNEVELRAWDRFRF